MSTERQVAPGWVEAASRLLRVTLESPRVKKTLSTVLGHLDPDYAPDLVRAALHTDPEVLHAVIAALPDGVNVLIEVVAALVREACERPVALMAAALLQLKERLRVRQLGQAVGQALARATALQQEDEPRASLSGKLLDGVLDGLRQQEVTPEVAMRALGLNNLELLLAGIEQRLEQEPGLAAGVAEISAELSAVLERHPAAVRQLLAPLLAPLLGAFLHAEGRAE